MAGRLVLGPVVFQAFEVPERLCFGGRQRLVVHALPGGGRVVDAMGAEEGPVTWEGVFSGPEAGVRVRALEAMRRGGEVSLLSWGGWRCTAIIELFEVQAENPAWIRYRIRLCVVSAEETAGDEDAVGPATEAEAAMLGGGGDLEAGISAAAAGLGSADVGDAIAAAGALARLVAARALLGSAQRGGA